MRAQKFISKNEVAAFLEVDVRSVSKYQNDPVDPLPIAVKGARGVPHKYDPGAVGRWMVRRELARHFEGADPEETYNYEKERARLTHEQADKVALENSVARGELIPAEVVTETWTESVINARARLLALPSKLAHQVEGADSIDEIREILMTAVYTALDELSTDELTDEQRSRIESASEGLVEGQAAATFNG